MGLKTWKMLEVQRAGWKSEQNGLAAQKWQNVGLLVQAAGRGLTKGSRPGLSQDGSGQ